MRHALHLPHWHFSPAHISHPEHTDEDAAVRYMLLGAGIAVLSVIVIYLYSASL